MVDDGEELVRQARWATDRLEEGVAAAVRLVAAAGAVTWVSAAGARYQATLDEARRDLEVLARRVPAVRRAAVGHALAAADAADAAARQGLVP